MKASCAGSSDTAIMEGGLDLLVRQPLQHQADHAQVDPGVTGGRQKLIVFAHAAIAADPGEGPLDDPPSREELKARRSQGRLLVCRQPRSTPTGPHHHRQAPAQRPPHPVCSGPTYALAAQISSRRGRRSATVSSRRGAPARSWRSAGGTSALTTNPRGSTSRWRLRPQSFLAPSSPCGPPRSLVFTDWLSILAALGVGGRPACRRSRARSGGWICSHVPSRRHLPQGGERRPGAVVARRQPPLTPAAQDVKEASTDPAQIDSTRASTRRWWREPGGKKSPLLLGQVRGVGQGGSERQREAWRTSWVGQRLLTLPHSRV